MLTAEQQKLVEAGAIGALFGVTWHGGYNPPPMLKVPKETAWRLYNSMLGVPTSTTCTPADFAKWRAHAVVTLGTIFGDDSPLVTQLKEIAVEPEIAIAGGLGADYHAKVYKQGCDEALSLIVAVNQRINSAPDDPPTSSPAGNHARASAYTRLHVTKAEALQKLRAAADSVPNDKDCDSEIFHDWFTRTLADVMTIFGDDSTETDRFAEISFRAPDKIVIRASMLTKRHTIEHEKALRIRQAYVSGCQKAEKKLREWIELVGYEPDVPPNPAPAKEKTVGNFGEIVRGEFKMMHREQGKQVIIFKNYGKPDQWERRIKALKVQNDGDAFQFLDVIDVVPGDVIQEEGSTRLWRVTDTTEHTEDGVFTDFEASVERATASGASQSQPGGITIGNVYGGVQLNSPHAKQSVSITINQQVLETVNRIKDAVDHSDELDEHDRDEIRHELDRVCELAKGPQSDKAIKRINERLTTVEKMIGIATKLAPIALPWILWLREYFERHGH